jgi:hypothetical protein
VDITNNAVWLKEGKQSEGSKSGYHSTDIFVDYLTTLSELHQQIYRK